MLMVKTVNILITVLFSFYSCVERLHFGFYYFMELMSTTFFNVLFKYFEFDNTQQNPIYYYRCQDLLIKLSIPLLVYNRKSFLNSNNIPEQ